MPRHRLPEGEKRESISIRIPEKALHWFARKGNARKEIEKILLDIFERETKGK